MPRSPFRVALRRDGTRSRVAERRLVALARRVLAGEGVEPPAVLSIIISNDATLRRLNRQFRGIDAATDVLSFALDDAAFPTPNGARVIGEVIISHPTAARQARAARQSVDDELAHLLVHGTLHLLGYDHQTERDAVRMRAREEALLGASVHGNQA
jgi:probable rRNA maturation factor